MRREDARNRGGQDTLPGGIPGMNYTQWIFAMTLLEGSPRRLFASSPAIACVHPQPGSEAQGSRYRSGLHGALPVQQHGGAWRSEPREVAGGQRCPDGRLHRDRWPRKRARHDRRGHFLLHATLNATPEGMGQCSRNYHRRHGAFLETRSTNGGSDLNVSKIVFREDRFGF